MDRRRRRSLVLHRHRQRIITVELKSFGCSFIFGSELSDIALRRDLRPSSLTWPALIAARNGWQYQCHAYPGRGNLYITNSVLSQIPHSKSEVIFVINWTWIDRFDYFDPSTDNWQSILPNDQNKAAGYYHRWLHSQRRDKLSSLINAVLVLDTLQSHQIPFVMTFMDGLMLENTWHQDTALQYLQQRLTPHLCDFQGRDFLTWSRANRYPITELWHPLTQAHEAAAQVMDPRVQQALAKMPARD
jgi:hypothetical protein